MKTLKNSSLKKWLVSALIALPLTAFAHSQPDGKRLIEVRPGKRFWATAAEREAISARAHREGRCGGFMDVTDFHLRPNLRRPFRLFLEGREPREQAVVTPLLKEADPGNLIGLVTRLSAYPDRYFDSKTGAESAQWIADQYRGIGKKRPDVSVELVQHDFQQPSVIATIQGSGPQKDEIVVVGAHLDSISNGKTAPGADDNASGTATVMEAFRIIADSGFRPNRTLQFMGFAGEEVGLLGSQDIATNYRNANRKVAAALQMDMTMFPGNRPRVTFITDYTDKDLTKFLERLMDEYVKAPWTEDVCGYACSDHASWTKAGYASSFPFEAVFDDHNPDIHTTRDVVKNLDATHGLHYLKLVVAYMIEMGETSPAKSFRPVRHRY